jgi:hypothetical protein
MFCCFFLTSMDSDENFPIIWFVFLPVVNSLLLWLLSRFFLLLSFFSNLSTKNISVIWLGEEGVSYLDTTHLLKSIYVLLPN